MTVNAPKVFVSYAHESEEHKAQVLAFATFLRHKGIEAVLDLWSAEARQDWYTWAIREMTDACFVLVVASERYRMTGDGNGPNAEHRGVQSEAALLRELIYSDRAKWLPKVLPVVLPGHKIDQIPLFLQPHTASRFHVASFDTAGAEELLRVILRQPRYPAPDLPTEQLVLPPHRNTQNETAPGQTPAVPTERARVDNRVTDAVVASVLTDGFSGRKWLIGQIDEFLRRQPSGYVWIEADAGMGKSALAAYLVRQRGWIGHFARVSNGGSARVCLQNLASQLIKQYELWEECAPAEMLPERTFTPGGFEQVLARAASRADRPLVLLVDGADEAEIPAGMQPWGLPNVLPPGVFVVGTYRTGSPPRWCEAPREILPIRPDDDHNRADVAEHIHRVLQDDELATRLTQAGVAADQFAADLAARCGGVWVYLRYVLDELRRGLRAPGDIRDLPADLHSFYITNLDRWSSDEKWQDGLLPLLATLAVAGEPLTVAALARLAGADEPSVRRWCNSTLRPFLTATSTPAATPPPRQFEIYHASLREVFVGPCSDANWSEDQWRWSEMLRPATIAAHNHIAEHYLSLFGGLDNGLPLLAADPSLARHDDGYALRHLAQHLIKAGRAKDLHRMLRAERRIGANQAVNAWFAAHDYADTGDTYLADIVTARQDSEECTNQALAANHPAPSLCCELRYHLIGASITSRTNNIPVQLLVCLLTRGVWSPERTLAHARRLATPTARADALIALIPHLPAAHRSVALSMALAAATAITHEYPRAETLTTLAPHLPANHSTKSSIAMMATYGPAHTAAEALTKLAPHLSVDQLSEALTAALALPIASLRAEALAGLAPYLSASQLTEALTAARAFSYKTDRARALTGLAPHVTGKERSVVLVQALAAATAIFFEHDRAQVLTGLAPYLYSSQLSEALAAATGIQHEEYRAKAFAGLAPHLSVSQLTKALADVAAIQRGPDRADALTGLAPNLSIDQLTKALTIAIAITDKFARARALTGLAPHLAGEEFAQALAAARAITDEFPRAQALTGLAPHTPGKERRAVLSEALAATAAMHYAPVRAKAWATLAPHLAADQLSEALATATVLPDGFTRGLLLTSLTPHLRGEEQSAVLFEALNAVIAIEHDYIRPQALATLAPLLPDILPSSKLSQVVAAATAITNQSARAQALTALAPHLPANQLSEALTAATTITDRSARTRALTGLAPNLTAGQLAEALAAATAITDQSALVQALTALAPHLRGDDRSAVLTEALTTAITLPREDSRADALIALAPHLSTDQLAEALAAAIAMQRDSSRADALTGLAPHLPANQLTEALTAATTIPATSARINALTGLAPQLSTDQLTEALAAATAIPNEFYRAQALAGLAPHLPDKERSIRFSEALAVATTIPNESVRAGTLAALASHLPAEQLAEALAAATTLPPNQDRARALAALAPFLPTDQIAAALAAASTITFEWDRTRALTALAPHLSREQLAEALTAATTGNRWIDRAPGMTALAPHLSREQLAEALTAAMVLLESDARARALAELAPYLPADLLAKALTAATIITYDKHRAHALTRLAPYLPADELTRALKAVPYGYSDPLCSLMVRAAHVLRTGPATTYVSQLRTVLQPASRDACIALLAACIQTLRDIAGPDFDRQAASTLREVHRWRV